MTDLPKLALSVRQPWAWAIIHAGKDIENRSWQAVNHGLRQRGRIAIHCAKGMTAYEYDDASAFMRQIIGIECPAANALLRGGIIGSVEVIDVVSKSSSPWFMGPRGLVLRDPRPCPFITQTMETTVTDREWTQDEIDDDVDGYLPFICPVTNQPCVTEEDEFCEDYGCARKAGIDVDRDII